MHTDPYSVSSSPGSDVARLFAKRSSKSCAPSEVVHNGSRAHKTKECVHTLKSCVCVLTLLPGDDETEYREFSFSYIDGFLRIACIFLLVCCYVRLLPRSPWIPAIGERGQGEIKEKFSMENVNNGILTYSRNKESKFTLRWTIYDVMSVAGTQKKRNL